MRTIFRTLLNMITCFCSTDQNVNTSLRDNPIQSQNDASTSTDPISRNDASTSTCPISQNPFQNENQVESLGFNNPKFVDMFIQWIKNILEIQIPAASPTKRDEQLTIADKYEVNTASTELFSSLTGLVFSPIDDLDGLIDVILKKYIPKTLSRATKKAVLIDLMTFIMLNEASCYQDSSLSDLFVRSYHKSYFNMLDEKIKVCIPIINSYNSKIPAQEASGVPNMTQEDRMSYFTGNMVLRIRTWLEDVKKCFEDTGVNMFSIEKPQILYFYFESPKEVLCRQVLNFPEEVCAFSALLEKLPRLKGCDNIATSDLMHIKEKAQKALNFLALDEILDIIFHNTVKSLSEIDISPEGMSSTLKLIEVFLRELELFEKAKEGIPKSLKELVSKVLSLLQVDVSRKAYMSIKKINNWKDGGKNHFACLLHRDCKVYQSSNSSNKATTDKCAAIKAKVYNEMKFKLQNRYLNVTRVFDRVSEVLTNTNSAECKIKEDKLYALMCQLATNKCIFLQHLADVLFKKLHYSKNWTDEDTRRLNNVICTFINRYNRINNKTGFSDVRNILSTYFLPFINNSHVPESLKKEAREYLSNCDEYFEFEQFLSEYIMYLNQPRKMEARKKTVPEKIPEEEIKKHEVLTRFIVLPLNINTYTSDINLINSGEYISDIKAVKNAEGAKIDKRRIYDMANALYMRNIGTSLFNNIDIEVAEYFINIMQQEAIPNNWSVKSKEYVLADLLYGIMLSKLNAVSKSNMSVDEGCERLSEGIENTKCEIEQINTFIRNRFSVMDFDRRRLSRSKNMTIETILVLETIISEFLASFQNFKYTDLHHFRFIILQMLASFDGTEELSVILKAKKQRIKTDVCKKTLEKVLWLSKNLVDEDTKETLKAEICHIGAIMELNPILSELTEKKHMHEHKGCFEKEECIISSVMHDSNPEENICKSQKRYFFCNNVMQSPTIRIAKSMFETWNNRMQQLKSKFISEKSLQNIEKGLAAECNAILFYSAESRLFPRWVNATNIKTDFRSQEPSKKTESATESSFMREYKFSEAITFIYSNKYFLFRLKIRMLFDKLRKAKKLETLEDIKKLLDDLNTFILELSKSILTEKQGKFEANLRVLIDELKFIPEIIGGGITREEIEELLYCTSSLDFQEKIGLLIKNLSSNVISEEKRLPLKKRKFFTSPCSSPDQAIEREPSTSMHLRSEETAVSPIKKKKIGNQ